MGKEELKSPEKARSQPVQFDSDINEPVCQSSAEAGYGGRSTMHGRDDDNSGDGFEESKCYISFL